jgi:hypothetical protein
MFFKASGTGINSDAGATGTPSPRQTSTIFSATCVTFDKLERQTEIFHTA